MTSPLRHSRLTKKQKLKSWKNGHKSSVFSPQCHQNIVFEVYLILLLLLSSWHRLCIASFVSKYELQYFL